MPYCPDCAVEVDDTVELCPLCGTVVQNEVVAPQTLYPHMIDPPVRMTMPWSQLRARLFAVLTGLCMIPFLIVSLVDVFDGRVTWSKYAMITLASLWLYCGLGLYKIRKPVQLVLGYLAVTSGLLLGLDLCRQGMTWFLTLAGPAVLAWALWSIPFVWLATRRKLGWANGAGWCLVGITVFCMALDMLISYHTIQTLVPSWSLIVLICLLPVIVILMYVHYRVRKQVNLGKWFHV